VRPTGLALAIAAVIAATVPELPTTLVASTEEIRDPVSQSRIEFLSATGDEVVTPAMRTGTRLLVHPRDGSHSR